MENGDGGVGDGGEVVSKTAATTPPTPLTTTTPAGTATVVATVNPSLNGNAPPPFLSKTYNMVEDPESNEIVSWGTSNNSFVVWNPPEFARDLLPKYFKHNNFSSFVRQLNTYNQDCELDGFRKVDPDRWEFANEGFLRGQKHMLKTINRRKPVHANVNSQSQQTPVQNSSVTPYVEVGKFGLEEEIDRLKRDKNVLMQELVRLRQHQQNSDNQLQMLGKRFKVMEQRQQQMMSFLAKAMRNPAFFAQFVQQNDPKRRIAGVNKKRRLPNEGEMLNGETPEGQLVKYQPAFDGAEKSLKQILKMENSHLSDQLSLGTFSSSPSSFDCSMARNSGVTLSEVPTNSGAMPVSANSGSEVSAPPVGPDQSSAGVASNIGADVLPDIGVLSAASGDIPLSPPGMLIPEFPDLEGIVPDESGVEIPVENLLECEPENLFDIDPNAFGLEETLPNETYNFPADIDVENIDGIFYPYWEQFLATSPASGEAQEADTSMEEGSENVWNSTQHMDSLTKQLGLL